VRRQRAGNAVIATSPATVICLFLPGVLLVGQACGEPVEPLSCQQYLFLFSDKRVEHYLQMQERQTEIFISYRRIVRIAFFILHQGLRNITKHFRLRVLLYKV
jgi:hypothetical protein